MTNRETIPRVQTSEVNGPTKPSSSCPAWAMLWDWGMSGNFPTPAFQMVEVSWSSFILFYNNFPSYINFYDHTSPPLPPPTRKYPHQQLLTFTNNWHSHPVIILQPPSGGKYPPPSWETTPPPPTRCIFLCLLMFIFNLNLRLAYIYTPPT